MPSNDTSPQIPRNWHRTSDYKPEYIDKVYEYLENKCADVVTEFHKTRGTKANTYEQKIEVYLPTKEDFAIYIGVSRKTLYNWSDEHDDFAEALDLILTIQKVRLINGGLGGKYNHVVTDLILSANHGMKKRVDSTTNDEPVNNFSEEQVDRIADRIAKRKSSDDSSSS